MAAINREGIKELNSTGAVDSNRECIEPLDMAMKALCK